MPAVYVLKVGGGFQMQTGFYRVKTQTAYRLCDDKLKGGQIADAFVILEHTASRGVTGTKVLKL